jgi:hypothetical protein
MTNTYNAFHNDAAIKQSIIDRLQHHWSSGRVTPFFHMTYSEATGPCSVMGATIEGIDEAEYERQLGIPFTAAYLHENILQYCGYQPMSKNLSDSLPFVMADFAYDYPVQWLQTISLGADLSSLVPRFVAWLLNDLLNDNGQWVQHIDPAVQIAGMQVSALYESALAGSTVTAAQWKQARHAAVDTTNASQHKFSRKVSEFFEAIAWSPESSVNELHGHVTSLWFALRDLLEHPQMNADDIAQQDALAKATEEIEMASQTAGFDPHVFLKERPDIKAVFDSMATDTALQRKSAIQEASLPEVYKVARCHFETFLQLTRMTERSILFRTWP